MEGRERSDSSVHISGAGEEGGGDASGKWMGLEVVGISVPFPGAKRPLEEGAKLGWWKFHELYPYAESEILIPEGDLYILGAWDPHVYPTLVEQLNNLGKRIWVLWTSSVGEVDFTPVEQGFLRWILDELRVEKIWFGGKGWEEVFPERGFHAPYPYVSKLVVEEGLVKRDIVTLFCTGSVKKNILNMLMGFTEAQRQMRSLGTEMILHTNLNIETDYPLMADQMEYERHGWLPKGEYEALIQSARLNLAVSWAETFNYQVAEALDLGTLSIISPGVPLPGVVVGNPNDPTQIAFHIMRSYKDENLVKMNRDKFLKGVETMNAICHRRVGRQLIP